MSEATTEGRFCIDLPDSDAATALSGTGQSTLHRLESLTGASFVLRGLQLEIKGNSYSFETTNGVGDERIVRSNVTLTAKAYLIPEHKGHVINTQNFWVNLKVIYL